MKIEPAQSVKNLTEWCIHRINASNDAMDEARKDLKAAQKVVGDSMRELREDAGVDIKDISKYMTGNSIMFDKMEKGMMITEWTEKHIEDYAYAIGRLYLENK